MTETLQFGWDICVVHDDANLTSYVIDDGKTVKVFRGETAWSDAERLADDIVTERSYA